MPKYTISVEKRPGINGGSIAWIEPRLEPTDKELLSEDPRTASLVGGLKLDLFSQSEGYFLSVEELTGRGVFGDVHKTVHEVVHSISGRLAGVLQDAGIEVDVEFVS